MQNKDYTASRIEARTPDKKSWRKLEDDIIMDLEGIRYESVDWNHLAQTSALANTRPTNARSFFLHLSDHYLSNKYLITYLISCIKISVFYPGFS